MFDTNPEVIGKSFSSIPVHDVKELYDFCKREKVTIGVLTVPKEAAYEVCRVLISAGVRGIWNFANMELVVDNSDVVVQDVHLGDSLMTLCYEIKCRNSSSEEENND